MLHDRNPLYVKLSDGGIAQRLHGQDSQQALQPRSFSLGVSAAQPERTLSIVGHGAGRPIRVITVPADELQSVRVYVTLDKSAVQPRFRRHPPSSPLWSAAIDGTTSAQHANDLPGTRAMTARTAALDQRHRRAGTSCGGSSAFFGVIFAVNGDLRLCRRWRPSAAAIHPIPTARACTTTPRSAASERQAERGWQTDIAYDAKTGRLALSFVDKTALADHGAQHQCHA